MAQENQIIRIRFQANGRRLMLALADGSIRFVEVDTTSLSLDQLEARARVLSGMRSSASSDLLPLNRDELREA